MSRQETTLTITRTKTVPDGARVRHYDELDETSQAYLSAAANGHTTPCDAPELSDGDVIVFTEYYRVART